jgi:hypothetical protein
VTARVRRIDELTRAELAVLVREYLLGGQLIDRAGMPHVIGAHGREVMGEIAIDEWMGASPIYTRRMQRLLGFVGDDVETIFKGMQFDIGAPPEFMDFRYRVIDATHGEFWLDHCGALMDVEPMGDAYVQTMCHTIEDPTFDATACATNPRARMTPVHRPPRVPSDRHPHCRWNVEIVADAEPVAEPEPAVRMGSTRLAALPLPEISAPLARSTRPEVESARTAEEQGGQDGWDDYSGPLDPDLRTEQFSRAALLAVAEEVGVQGHLLVMSFLQAVERRSSVEEAVAVGVRQFTGVAGLVAERLKDAFALGTDLVDIAQVLELHPAFRPRSYIDWRVEHSPSDAGGTGSLRLHLGECEALREQAVESWISSLADGRATEALDAIVRAVDPGARCVAARPADGAVATWDVVTGAEPAEESPDVTLAKFSTGTRFAFSETPVSLG